MPKISSYISSILLHESKFTHYFQSLGYKSDSYINNDDYRTEYPVFFEMLDTYKKGRNPIIKVRPFFHTPAFSDERPSRLGDVVDYLKDINQFPMDLFWDGVLRRASLRNLYTNLGYQFVLGDAERDGRDAYDSIKHVAAIAHIYYEDTAEEIYEYLSNIPQKFDLYVTVPTEELKLFVEEIFGGRSSHSKLEVKVVAQNRGRDMSSLFIEMKHVVLDNEYDWIVRIHSKKSPQNDYSIGRNFKDHVYSSVLSSKGYVQNLFEFFDRSPEVGVAFGPMIHTGFPTLGYAWFTNKDGFSIEMKRLGLSVPPEDHSPLAPFGTVYWFKPSALRPLFEAGYSYTEYNQEPNHLDGGLAHVQERMIGYVAQSQGYMSACVWPNHIARQANTLLEFKADATHSVLPNFRHHRGRMDYLLSVNPGGNSKLGITAPINLLLLNMQEHNNALLRFTGKTLRWIALKTRRAWDR